ncbi:MAG: CHASE2 domain-containing protein [Chthoniobacterales bacterium]
MPRSVSPGSPCRIICNRFFSCTCGTPRATRSRAGRTTPASPDLVFLAIDSDSVSLDSTTDVKELYGLTNEGSAEAHALKLMSKAWPWPREVYALVLQRLVDAGAKVVAFDLTFPTATPDDPAFQKALQRSSRTRSSGATSSRPPRAATRRSAPA